MAKPTTVGASADVLETKSADHESKHPAAGIASWADERMGLGKIARFGLRKVFPDHWSFLLGEIALYTFIICLLTGIFLTIWFKPSMAEVTYDGSYQLLKGVPISEAFASTLHISFDVRGGLLLRQIHHWSALLFVASATVHALRVFFTGAFRKPREVNWLIGVGLLGLSLLAGFSGYSLPDDLLSGTGLRFADGLIRSIPILGTWIEFFLFNGEFPGDMIISRLYMAHILLIPGLLLGLIAAHMALLVYHKHTQYPGPGRTNNNVVGYPMFPVYAAKAGGFFFIVFGMMVLFGGLFQINPVWLYGPYDPAKVTAGSQPDWYMGFAEGFVRIMPPWEWHIGSTTWSWNVFIPGVGGLTILFTLLALWPFVERWITGDKREHHILDRPRNAPTRTALGVAGMTAYAVLWLGGANDILAIRFGLNLNQITIALQILLFAGPVTAFILTRRLCLSLQRADRERVLHGSESGEIVRTPEGRYYEDHVPLSDEEAFALTQHAQYPVVEANDGTSPDGVAGPVKVSKWRAALSKWYLGHDIPKPTGEEIADAHGHDEPALDAPAPRRELH
ncbi:cytochrome bc complex cytochrome b subunit [Tessaracoccus sp. OH4464_COT-324]|uniref:cytochrome bc1 complex cytochrome b subunit n=1 Tax=Tessaracoccus sp. OH4464_COT-324 TaxID=2491059 RepID=UPI000F640CA2|nr:cytochrome bc complex cytochrome b subunit [Tessaracoccus sp. OH4464_COT-324]RRD45758.1 cytochrome bc complex cytochrome b subunit [Tessaracoccus sp. OH4464_COT-324]